MSIQIFKKTIIHLFYNYGDEKITDEIKKNRKRVSELCHDIMLKMAKFSQTRVKLIKDADLFLLSDHRIHIHQKSLQLIRLSGARSNQDICHKPGIFDSFL